MAFDWSSGLVERVLHSVFNEDLGVEFPQQVTNHGMGHGSVGVQDELHLGRSRSSSSSRTRVANVYQMFTTNLHKRKGLSEKYTKPIFSTKPSRVGLLVAFAKVARIAVCGLKKTPLKPQRLPQQVHFSQEKITLGFEFPAKPIKRRVHGEGMGVI